MIYHIEHGTIRVFFHKDYENMEKEILQSFQNANNFSRLNVNIFSPELKFFVNGYLNKKLNHNPQNNPTKNITKMNSNIKKNLK